MGILKWIFGKKEYISPQALRHSSLGDYNTVNRMTGGGHGQEAIDYMKRNNIKFNIVKKYDNGVRVGNVPNHKDKRKKTGEGQSWFPASWDRNKIKRAGQVVARGKILPDGSIKYGQYNNVNVGVIRTNSKIATIFPTIKQLTRKGKERNEYKQTKRSYHKRKKY